MTDVPSEGRRAADLASVASVALEETGPPRVVLAGDPTTACAVIHEDADIEVGIWTVTPGTFRSVKHGVSESMHFIAGAGRIEHPDGSATVIAPGTVLHLIDGWEGTWHVTELVRKSYVIVRTPAPGAAEDVR